VVKQAPKPKGRGRPKKSDFYKEKDYIQINVFGMVGATVRTMATHFRTDKMVIQRYLDDTSSEFSIQYKNGKENILNSLRSKQIECAMNGNTALLIFLGKNMLGQSDQGNKDKEEERKGLLKDIAAILKEGGKE